MSNKVQLLLYKINQGLIKTQITNDFVLQHAYVVVCCVLFHAVLVHSHVYQLTEMCFSLNCTAVFDRGPLDRSFCFSTDTFSLVYSH